jgi:hypothetical protein
MMSPNHRVKGAVVLAAVSLLTLATAFADATVLRLDQLTKEQYALLPADTVIVVNGRRVTKGAIREHALQQMRQASAKLAAETKKGQVRLLAERRRALQLEQTDFAALSVSRRENKIGTTILTARNQMSSLPAIRKEAAELSVQARTASLVQLQKIDERAEELLRQLQSAQ